MNAVVTFTSPSGDELVVVPKRDYDRLVEAAEDTALARLGDVARAQLDAGDDELLSPDIGDRLLAGENPVRVYRDLRGLSLERLAREAGIEPSRLAAVEEGALPAEAGIREALAQVLRVLPDDLEPARID
jgi:DNA-binding XRE family transcriptional regulator